MRLWRVIVLMAVTLAVGIGLGYVRWGRETRELREALARAQAIRPQLTAAPGPWTARGVVRIVLPNQGVLFLTHEAIPGLMPGATRAFAVAGAGLFAGLSPGDPVRFTLERRGQLVVLVAIERDKVPLGGSDARWEPSSSNYGGYREYAEGARSKVWVGLPGNPPFREAPLKPPLPIPAYVPAAQIDAADVP